MAGNPYDELVDKQLQTQGGANTVVSHDVAPEQAVAAIIKQRNGGPPAVLGMYEANDTGVSPGVTYGSIPPPVARFATDPARAAAVRDDHAELGYVASLHDQTIGEWKRSYRQAQKYAQDMINAKSIPEGIIGGVSWLATSFATPFAPLGPGISQMVEDIDTATPKFLKRESPYLTPEQNAEMRRGAIGIAMTAFGGGTRAAPVAKPVAGAAPKPAAGPAPRTPDGRFPVDGEGLVVNADGVPMEFTSQREAALWAKNKGHVDSPDQLFETFAVDKDGASTIHVRQRGFVEEAPTNPGVRPEVDDALRTYAEADAVALRQMQEAVAEAKLHTRDPVLMREYLEQLGDDATIHVAPAAVQKVWLETDAQPFSDMAQELATAEALGRDVEIPVARYLAETAGKPWAEQLNAGVRVRENGVSLDETKELPETKAVEGEADAAINEDIAAYDYAHHTTELAAEELAEVTSAAPVIAGAVKRASQNQYLNTLFKDAKAADMTKTQMSLWGKRLEVAQAAAQETMFRRLVAQLKKERTPEWKAEFTQRLAEVEAELAVRPDVQAYFYLRYNEAVNGAPLEQPPVKLNKTDAVMAYGSAFVENLPKEIWAKVGEGESPDALAQELGFDNGQAMLASVRDLDTAMKAAKLAPKEYIRQQAKAQATNAARAELGFDTSPEGIAAAAQEAMVNPKVEDLLVAELKELAKEAKLPFDKATVEAAAAEAFAGMTVKDALNIRAHERAVSKLAREAEVFVLKGKFVEGFGKKQQQLLNQLMLKEAWAFTRENRKYQRKLSTWSSNANIAGMSQTYLDRIHANMAVMQYKVPRFKDELTRAIGGVSNADFAWNKSAEGVSVYTAEVPEVPIGEQRVEAYREVMRMLESLAHNGAAEQKVWNGVRDEDEAQLIEEMQTVAAQVPVAKLPQGVGGDLTVGEAGGKLARGFDAFLSTMHRVFGMLDNGDFNGPWNRVFMGGATEAANTIYHLQKDVYEPIDKDFAKSMPTALKRAWNTVVEDHPFMDPRTGFQTKLRFRRGQLLSVVANMGTEANLQRLMSGYGIEDFQALHAFVDKLLTPEELAWMNRTWERMDDVLFPLEETNKRKLDGVGMHKEKAVPVEFTVGEARGGYWPLAYDMELKTGAPAKHAEKTDADLFQHPFRRVTTSAGFEQARTGGGGAVFLSLDGVLKSHLDEVFTRIAYGQYIRSAVRMLGKGEVRDIVRQRLGPEYLKQIENWLEYLVADPNAAPAAWRTVNQALAVPRNNMVLTYIAGSISVSVKQAQGLLTSVGEIGLADTAVGFYSFWKAVATGKLDADIISQSKELQRRVYQLDQNMADTHDRMRGITRNMLGVAKFRKNFADLSMKMIGYADRYFTSGVVWSAARNKYLRLHLGDGRDPAVVMDEAHRYADAQVIRTQGSGARKDLSSVRRTNQELARIYTFAYSNVEAMYNLYMDTAHEFRKGNWGAGLKKFMWFAAIMPVLTAWFNDQIPDDVKDDPAKFLEWWAWEAGLTLPKTIPGIRDAAEYVERKHFGQYATPGSTPLGRATESVQKATSGKSKKPIKDTMTAAGFVLGVPAAGQIGKTGQYVYDIATGEAQPENPAQLITGLVSGENKE